MKQYRKLNPDEILLPTDEGTSIHNEQGPPPTGLINCSQLMRVGQRADCCVYLIFYRFESVRPQRLTRKYRLVRDDKPIQMFDWFTTEIIENLSSSNQPDPNDIHGNGWCQITPESQFEHMLDGHPSNRRGFTYARFVDCVPRK